MIVSRERTAKSVTNTHRATMRRIPLALLSASYEQLLDGRSEWSVCVDLEVMPEAFEGVLQSALEEALWERGYFRRSHQIDL